MLKHNTQKKHLGKIEKVETVGWEIRKLKNKGSLAQTQVGQDEEEIEFSRCHDSFRALHPCINYFLFV